MILPCARTDHKIYNETHLKSFINKEKGEEEKKGRCTGLSESNIVRESEVGISTFFKGRLVHAHRGLQNHNMHRLSDYTAHRLHRA